MEPVNQPSNPIKCDYEGCTDTFKDKKQKENHVQRKHSKEQELKRQELLKRKQYSCDRCLKGFVRTKELKRHLKLQRCKGTMTNGMSNSTDALDNKENIPPWAGHLRQDDRPYSNGLKGEHEDGGKSMMLPP